MLSLLSSIATLILFSFYFIGRIITTASVKKLWKDKIILKDLENCSYDIVDEIFDSRASCDSIFGLLVSVEGMRNISVFSVDIDYEKGLFHKKELLLNRSFLNIDQAIAIHVMPGDLFPTLLIEYTTFDYLKVQLEWRDNLRNGVYSELVQPRHTLKSILYYLLK